MGFKRYIPVTLDTDGFGVCNFVENFLEQSEQML